MLRGRARFLFYADLFYADLFCANRIEVRSAIDERHTGYGQPLNEEQQDHE